MTIEEVIEQLGSIKIYCEELADDGDPGEIWHKDIKALEIAIKVLKKSPGLES